MNSLMAIFFMVLSILSVPVFSDDMWDAEEAYSESELKDEVKKQSFNCLDLVKPPPDPMDVALFFMRDICSDQASAQVSTRCWITCIMNKINILNITREAGKMKAFFDRFAMKDKVEHMRGDGESKGVFLQNMESCAARAEQDNQVYCDVGYEMLRCYCRTLKQHKPKPAPRTGDRP